MNPKRFKKSMWGLPVNTNGWLFLKTKADAEKVASITNSADSIADKFPCFIHWIYNANNDPEFVTVQLQDAVDLIHASK